jgi:hypothetical protein
VTSAPSGLAPEDLARGPLADALFAIEAGVRGLPEPRSSG